VRVILNIILALALCAALIVLAAYIGQRRLLYFPDRVRTQPAAVGLPTVTEHEIKAPDGTYVIAWWGRAKPGQPTLLYFHGNAQSLAARQPRIERALAEGWGIMMMTYRGFGGSTGSPTEADNVADAARTFAFLTSQGVRPADIILYGESLGTGVATQLAVQQPGIRGLILDAPFTSTVDVGKLRFPFLPVEWGMRDRYETKRYIGQVKVPVYIMHGARDGIVPVEMGREIARLANEPKRYVEFPNGGHIDLYINGNDALTPLKTWIAALSSK
jgi:uncharacterized protein